MLRMKLKVCAISMRRKVRFMRRFQYMVVFLTIFPGNSDDRNEKREASRGEQNESPDQTYIEEGAEGSPVQPSRDSECGYTRLVRSTHTHI